MPVMKLCAPHRLRLIASYVHSVTPLLKPADMHCCRRACCGPMLCCKCQVALRGSQGCQCWTAAVPRHGCAVDVRSVQALQYLKACEIERKLKVA